MRLLAIGPAVFRLVTEQPCVGHEMAVLLTKRLRDVEDHM
jgi:hypothetical protein